jgi:hypothetical protein
MAADAERYATVREYRQRSVLKRIEAFFLDNIGKIATREMLQEVAKDPKTGKIPENWHQRLSDLRCLHGYTIRSWRNQGDLKIMEYLMPSTERRRTAKERVHISKSAWEKVMERCNGACEWNEAGEKCGLKEGDIDQVGGGTVRLQADHKNPHSINADTDPNNPNAWQALCGRHQVIKKNFWDSQTGKLNVYAIVQAAPVKVKREVFEFLKEFFGK